MTESMSRIRRHSIWWMRLAIITGLSGSCLYAAKQVQTQSLSADPSVLLDDSGQPVAGWSSARIGADGDVGSAVLDRDVIQVDSGGSRIGGTADAFGFVYVPWTGNVSIVTRVLSVEGGTVVARGGVMIRAGAEPGAVNVMLAVKAAGGVTFQKRAEPAVKTGFRRFHFKPKPGASGRLRVSLDGVWCDADADPAAAVSAPLWLKLERREGWITGYFSRDGRRWEWLATEEIRMPPSLDQA